VASDWVGDVAGMHATATAVSVVIATGVSVVIFCVVHGQVMESGRVYFVAASVAVSVLHSLDWSPSSSPGEGQPERL